MYLIHTQTICLYWGNKAVVHKEKLNILQYTNMINTITAVCPKEIYMQQKKKKDDDSKKLLDNVNDSEYE